METTRISVKLEKKYGAEKKVAVHGISTIRVGDKRYTSQDGVIEIALERDGGFEQKMLSLRVGTPGVDRVVVGKVEVDGKAVPVYAKLK